MFKVIASLKSNNGSNYLLSLCWLAFKVTLFKYFEKINGNYLSFAYCQIKSHFFLIPFLIFLKRATARTAWYHRDSLYIITQTVFLCQLFFNTFLKFFEIFLIFFQTSLRQSSIFAPSTWQLDYNTTFLYTLSTVF